MFWGSFTTLSGSLGGRLAVQPRMGFSDFEEMRAGLSAVHGSHADPVIGTITIDAFNRDRGNATAQCNIGDMYERVEA